ncbi:hypothetical protein [Candidatus Amarolinea dominans]|uniref:hypothetical protein n=1 Tax=Candidatus Amarolinea dominans TaxID=3140696 RepID=UPI0031CCA8A5
MKDHTAEQGRQRIGAAEKRRADAQDAAALIVGHPFGDQAVDCRLQDAAADGGRNHRQEQPAKPQPALAGIGGQSDGQVVGGRRLARQASRTGVGRGRLLRESGGVVPGGGWRGVSAVRARPR